MSTGDRRRHPRSAPPGSDVALLVTERLDPRPSARTRPEAAESRFVDVGFPPAGDIFA